MKKYKSVKSMPLFSMTTTYIRGEPYLYFELILIKNKNLESYLAAERDRERRK